MTTRTNEAAVQCKDCGADVEAGMGYDKYPGYGGELHIICRACHMTREQEKAEERERRTHATSFLMEMVPGLTRLGSIEEVRAGAEQYETSATILTKSGRKFTVVVREVAERR